MANFPRAGVLQSPMTNVYQMQQDIEANDPLRQALGLAGDVAGRYNKKAEYAQAAGMLDAPQTIGQKIGGAAKSAWNAISGGTSEDGNAEAPGNVLKAPNWSEMARVDPERARFDRSTFENDQAAAARANELKQKQELAGRELDLEKQKFEEGDNSIVHLKGLYAQTSKNINTLLSRGAQPDDKQLISERQKLDYLGKKISESGFLPIDETKSVQDEKKAPKGLSIGEQATAQGRAVMATAVDNVGPNGAKDPDGYIDNEGEIIAALNDVARLLNVNQNSEEWRAVLREWEGIKQRALTAIESSRTRKQIAQADADRLRNINIQGQKSYQDDPDVQSYKNASNAIAFFNASNKDIAAKRKMVYDFIKSYNTGTVLDSELASTLGATGDTFGTIVNWVKGAASLPPEITDQQADAIYGTLIRQIPVLKANADNAYSTISQTYGVSPRKINGVTPPAAKTNGLDRLAKIKAARAAKGIK